MSCTNPAAGSNLRVILDYEDCFNEAPTSTAGKIVPVSTLDVKLAQPPQQSTALRAGRHSSSPFYGNKVINGTMTGPVGVESIGFILKCMFGICDSTSNEHTFTIPETQDSFILSKEFTDIDHYYKYTGCVATGLNFTFNNNNELLYNLSFLAAEETHSTSTYDAAAESMADESFFSNPDIGSDSVEEGGSSTDIFTDISVNIASNPALVYGLGGGGSATYKGDGRMEITGNVQGIFADNSLIAKGAAHTESSLDITLSKSTNTLNFRIAELQYSQESPVVSGPGIVQLNLSYIGYYQDDSGGSDITVVLTNSRTDYL